MLRNRTQSLIGNIDHGAGTLLEGWVAVQDGNQLKGSRRIQLLLGQRVIGETVARLPRHDIPGRGSRADFGFRVKCSVGTEETQESQTLSIRDVETGCQLDTAFEIDLKKYQVLLDVGDTLIYLSHHSTVSGIQRVVIELYRALTRDLDFEISVIAGHESGCGHHRVSTSDWERLLEALDETPEDAPSIAVGIRESAFAADRVRIGPETVLLVLGSPWVSEDYIESILRARVQGAKVISLVYDLIPSRLPAMFDLSTKRRFERVMAAFAAVSDQVLSISEYSGQEFSEFCRELGLPAHDPIPIRLASALSGGNRVAGNGSIHDQFGRQPYVLLVSTVEGRKGHGIALDVWERLVRTLGRDKTPRLVFVGRPGWNSQSTFERLSTTNYVDGLVSLRSNVSDSQLAELYRDALFTIYPSTYEGWGLPVGESLSFGTPVIAADNTSIPEVGGSAVQYFRTGSSDHLFELVHQWIQDPSVREEWSSKARDWTEDTWPDVAERVGEVIKRLCAEADEDRGSQLPSRSIQLEAAEEVSFGFSRTSLAATDLMSLSWEIDVLNSTGIMGYPHLTAREVRGSLILRGSMFPPEPKGRWSRLGSPLGLSFRVDPAERWSLLLLASSGDATAAAFVRVSGNCRSGNHWVLSDRLISIDLVPDAAGHVDLDLEVQRRGTVPDDSRSLGLFLRTALLLSPDDTAGQTKLLISLGRVHGFFESLRPSGSASTGEDL